MLLRDCSPRFSAGLRPREDLSRRLQAMNGVYEEIVLAYNHWEQELRDVVQASSAPPHLVLNPTAYWARQTLPRLSNLRASTRKHTANIITAPSDMTLLPDLEGEVKPDEHLKVALPDSILLAAICYSSCCVCQTATRLA